MKQSTTKALEITVAVAATALMAYFAYTVHTDLTSRNTDFPTALCATDSECEDVNRAIYKVCIDYREKEECAREAEERATY